MEAKIRTVPLCFQNTLKHMQKRHPNTLICFCSSMAM